MQATKQFPGRRPGSPVFLISLLAVTAIGGIAGPAFSQEAPSAELQQTLVICASCHGADGNAVADPTWPSLAGQHASYTVRQLEAYKASQGAEPDEQARADLGMQGLAGTLTDQQMQDIAAFYAAQSMTPKGAEPARVDNGQRIYRGGIPERGVAACIACHGPSGQGNPLAGYPRVSQQHAAYLAKTLREYRAGGRRSDAELNQMMRNVAELLLDDEIEALASYMQGLN